MLRDRTDLRILDDEARALFRNSFVCVPGFRSAIQASPRRYSGIPGLFELFDDRDVLAASSARGRDVTLEL